MKYAIKVKFGDEFAYVMEGPMDNLRVSVMSLEDAEEAVRAWLLYGNSANIQIVEYNP